MKPWGKDTEATSNPRHLAAMKHKVPQPCHTERHRDIADNESTAQAFRKTQRAAEIDWVRCRVSTGQRSDHTTPDSREESERWSALDIGLKTVQPNRSWFYYPSSDDEKPGPPAELPIRHTWASKVTESMEIKGHCFGYFGCPGSDMSPGVVTATQAKVNDF